SSYPWKVVKRKRYAGEDPTPPTTRSRPGTLTPGAVRPGMMPSDVSDTRGFSAWTPTLLATDCRFNPKRTELVKLELKIWLSSRIRACRRVFELWRTRFCASPMVKGVSSYRSGPKILSLPEGLGAI